LKTATTDLATVKGEAMTSDELDRLAGGIIIVSGFQHQFASALERVALNRSRSRHGFSHSATDSGVREKRQAGPSTKPGWLCS
jgi:hypothetical protein